MGAWEQSRQVLAARGHRQAGFTVATTHQPHAIETLLSIDHIAVPEGVEAADVRRVSAAADGRRLSDHDACCGPTRNRDIFEISLVDKGF